MKHLLLLVLACLACASGELVEIYAEDEAAPLFEAQELQQDFRTPQDDLGQELAGQQQQNAEMLQLAAEKPLTDPLYVVEESTGSYRVTGMFQNVLTDQGSESINQLLERPRISFFDLSWSNWVDERLQILDLVQDLLVSSGSRCPHMQTESSSFDTGMVSYLASSRFGPAILTTYAQKIHEADDFDFDYDDVHISESAIGKSYEDASLLEDLSSNANQAFQEAELESRSLFQQDNLGFFAANLKSDQDMALYESQLDGEFESVQTSLKVPVSYFTRWNGFEDSDDEMLQQQYVQEEDAQLSSDHMTNCVIFVMLLVGCVYVWTSLARSCYETFSEAGQRKMEQRSVAYKLAQKELLAPLNPEKAEAMPLIETAALEAPVGTYYHAHGTGFEKVLVPLSKSPV